MTITDLIREAHETAANKGFWDTGIDGRDLPQKHMLIVEEVAEANAEIREGRSLLEVWYEGEKPCGYGIELADIIIRVCDLAGAFGIPLEGLIRAKMDYNKTRPYRHGKQF